MKLVRFHLRILNGTPIKNHFIFESENNIDSIKVFSKEKGIETVIPIKTINKIRVQSRKKEDFAAYVWRFFKEGGDNCL